MIPTGWKIVRDEKDHPFKKITVTSPNGYFAKLTCVERNPGNVLYLLAEALLAADEAKDESG